MNKLQLKKLFFCFINLKYIKSYFYGVCPLFETKSVFNFIEDTDVLLDIGSNKGQFSILFNNFFPNAKIFSFEPQIKYLKIQKKILPKKTKFYNCCLGDKVSNGYLNITKKNDSSSILDPQFFNSSIYKIVDKIKIKIDTLDNILKYNNSRKIFLKLDVQGYEKNVLKGAKKTLNNIQYILIELSSSKLYKKQHSKNDIIKFLKNKKFKIIKILNKNYISKRIYQADYLFAKIN